MGYTNSIQQLIKCMLMCEQPFQKKDLEKILREEGVTVNDVGGILKHFTEGGTIKCINDSYFVDVKSLFHESNV
jgi:hypothetical protein